MTALFRAQAVDAKRSGRMGAIGLATPLSLHLTTVIAVLMGAALLTFVFLGHYTRRERAHGKILPVSQLIPVQATSDGIAGSLVPNGSQIRKGDILARVSGIPLAAMGDGVVYDLRVLPGASVTSGQTLLTMLGKPTPMRASLEVSERAAGFVVNGAPVVLRYPVFPHQRFGYQRGRVSGVSRVPIANVTGGARYRVYVDLEDIFIIGPDKRREVIRPGMTVDADIFLERRSLAGWALAPLVEKRNKRAGSE